MHRKHPLLQRVNHLAYIISVFFLLLHLPVQAKSNKPYLTYYPGSTYVDGKALYVTGGEDTSRQIADQTFMIDLSVSWKTTSPVYKELPIVSSCYWCPATMSGDGRRWFLFSSGIGYAFRYPSQHVDSLPQVQQRIWIHSNYRSGHRKDLYPYVHYIGR